MNTNLIDTTETICRHRLELLSAKNPGGEALVRVHGCPLFASTVVAASAAVIGKLPVGPIYPNKQPGCGASAADK